MTRRSRSAALASIAASIALSLSPRLALAQQEPVAEPPPRPLRVSLGIGSSVLWRVSDGYELFDAARAAPTFDALAAVDVVRVGRFELDVHLGYRFDESRRRYAQTLGSALSAHTIALGVTARFAPRHWFAVFGRAQASSQVWSAQIVADAGDPLFSLAASFGGAASLGVMVRTGPLFAETSRVNMGLFFSLEGGAQLFNSAELNALPAAPMNEVVARDALPVSGPRVTRIHASTPFIRAIAGLRF